MIVTAAALVFIGSLLFIMVIQPDFGRVEYECHGLSILHLGFLHETMDTIAAMIAAAAAAAVVVSYWFERMV